MSEQPERTPASSNAEEAAQIGFPEQLKQILQAIRHSQVKSALIPVVLFIVVVVGATAYAQVLLNRWNKPFYDALSRRDLSDFLYQLGVFFAIAGSLLVLNVAQKWLVETLKLRLRERLVQDLVSHWMQPRRAFWLAHAGNMGVNPDQRMHEDARKLCELSSDLGVGLFQASILFASFAGVLWVLSADFSIRISGTDYGIPGFMLWAAILYAAIGSLVSYWVGRTLIGRNADRYAREADLRFSMVRINEHLDGISMAGGEADERRRIELDLDEVLAASRKLVTGLTNLTWVTAGFGWVTLVAPILVATPLYFAGKISFGGLMMAASAFTQAQSSLRWFVDNFSVIADWRATLVRVASFRKALVVTSGLPLAEESHIDHEAGEPGKLVLENLEIDSPAGRDRLRETDVVVAAGERVVVLCAPGTGKTQLFRALAGLWPWGSGRIRGPDQKQVLYLPRGTPYLPRGTLREVLAYPLDVARFDDQAYAHALERGALIRLLPALNEVRRWDRELSQEQQLRLAFARIVLHSPAWVIVDDVFGSLDDEALDRVIEVMNGELRQTGIIHIGRVLQGGDPLFTRTLHLVSAAEERSVAAATGINPNEAGNGGQAK